MQDKMAHVQIFKTQRQVQPQYETTMKSPPQKDPLHGVTLENILTKLVAHYDWQQLGERINIRCFTQDPSIQSSLKFLRKTPWAREKVEQLYIDLVNDRAS